MVVTLVMGLTVKGLGGKKGLVCGVRTVGVRGVYAVVLHEPGIHPPADPAVGPTQRELPPVRAGHPAGGAENLSLAGWL